MASRSGRCAVQPDSAPFSVYHKEGFVQQVKSISTRMWTRHRRVGPEQAAKSGGLHPAALE